jgi:hypothetical protein
MRKSSAGHSVILTFPASSGLKSLRFCRLLHPEAIRDGAIGDVNTLMQQYMTVESARDAMVDSNRDAESRPAGFKELEIATEAAPRRTG